MNGNPNQQRDPLEALADDFLRRYRRGERPSVTLLAKRYPALADDIRALFPTMLAMEHAKQAQRTEEACETVLPDDTPVRLGDYRIIREIGRGGMGVVYEAEQESLKRLVAIKLLPRRLTVHEDRRARFQREARTAAQLHHSNIVPVFGVGAHDGYDYFVMQRIRGVSLAAFVATLSRKDRNAPPPTNLTELIALVGQMLTGHQNTVATLTNANVPRDSYWTAIARLMAQAAGALDYAHEQGVLHRDIKPGNLLLDEEGVLWISDFGLAKAVDHDNLTAAGDVLGTLRYMAPEQFAGTIDERSDQYSLGITLYELATLRPAFGNSERSALISAIMSAALPAPRSIVPDLPRDLETIILKATAADPDRRYVRLRALQADLEDFIADRPIRARRLTTTERTLRWVRRHRQLAAALAVTATLTLAIAVVSTIAYFQVSAANAITSNALRDTQAQRERAARTAQLALDTLDAIFEPFAPTEVLVAGELTDDTDEITLTVARPPIVSPENADLLTSMLAFYQRLAAQEADLPNVQRKIAAAWARVGEINERLGNVEAARIAYVEAQSRYRALSANVQHASTYRLARAQLHNQIGRLHQIEDSPTRAAASFETALALLTLKSDETPSVEHDLERARTYFLMAQRPDPMPGARPRGPGRRPPPDHLFGLIRHGADPGKPHPAAALNSAVEILERLVPNKKKDPRAAHLLARCLAAKRPHHGFRTGFARSRDVRRATAILEDLAKRYPRIPQYRVDLADVLARWPDGPDTLERVERAEAILDQLVTERPNVPAYRFSLARVQLRRGQAARRQGEVEVARIAISAATHALQQLSERFPKVTSYTIAAAFYEWEYGRLLVQHGAVDDATAILQSALQRIASLGRRKHRRDVRDLASRCYRELSRAYRAQGRHALAADADALARSLGPGRKHHRPPPDRAHAHADHRGRSRFCSKNRPW